MPPLSWLRRLHLDGEMRLYNSLVLRHLLGNQRLPETIRSAYRPLEPKDVDSFLVIVMLSPEDDGEPNNVGIYSRGVDVNDLQE